MEDAEGRGEVVIEICRRAELRGGKAIVVVREAVGDYQMRSTADPDPMRPVVGIAVGIVKETAVFDEQRTGVRAWRIAALPAKRAATGSLFDAGDGSRDDLP